MDCKELEVNIIVEQILSEEEAKRKMFIKENFGNEGKTRGIFPI